MNRAVFEDGSKTHAIRYHVATTEYTPATTKYTSVMIAAMVLVCSRVWNRSGLSTQRHRSLAMIADRT